jgi:hypothetical protein
MKQRDKPAQRCAGFFLVADRIRPIIGQDVSSAKPASHLLIDELILNDSFTAGRYKCCQSAACQLQSLDGVPVKAHCSAIAAESVT